MNTLNTQGKDKNNTIEPNGLARVITTNYIPREWQHKGCAMTFGSRWAMQLHWKTYHTRKA